MWLNIYHNQTKAAVNIVTWDCLFIHIFNEKLLKVIQQTITGEDDTVK